MTSDIAILKFRSVGGWGRIMRAAELAGIEWSSDEPRTLTLYGEPARRFVAEAHKLGLPMSGFTEEISL